MRHVLWAGGAFLVLGFAAYLGVSWYVSAAYRFADAFPLADVGSWDQLYKLGPTAPSFTAIGLLAVAGVTALTTLILLIGRWTRPYAWIAPLAAALLVFLVVGIGTTMFVPPPPDLGG